MSSGAVKSGAVAGLLAAALLVLSAVPAIAFPAGGSGTAGEYIYRAVVVLAFLAVIVTVAGLHAVHAASRRYGRVGRAGSVVTAAGYGTFTIVTLLAMVGDVEYLLTVRLVGAVLVLLGSVLLGIAMIRARLLPWWCGVLLIVAFPLGDVANALFGTAENLLLAASWGALGLMLLRLDRTVPATPASTQPAATR